MSVEILPASPATAYFPNFLSFDFFFGFGTEEEPPNDDTGLGLFDPPPDKTCLTFFTAVLTPEETLPRLLLLDPLKTHQIDDNIKPARIC